MHLGRRSNSTCQRVGSGVPSIIQPGNAPSGRTTDRPMSLELDDIRKVAWTSKDP